MTVMARPAVTSRQVARVKTPHSLGVCNSAACGKRPSNLGCASDVSLQATLWLLQTSDKGEGSEIQLMCN